MFKRKAYDKLKEWKQTYSGRYACLLEGARRVGKSTIVEEFAKNEYESYIRIDFANVTDEMLDVFRDISKPDLFFLRLQAETGVNLKERKSAIIFDEIQLQPKVRQAIKYLVQDGRYDYIETGSLISIHKNVRNIIIPSEEEILEMYPMDYEEFMWALGDKGTIDLLREAWQKQRGFGDAVNRKLMRDFRLYMLVGGMPQAVSKYIDTKNLAAVDKVKRDIIRLYRNDFQKIDKTGKAMALFMAIPSQLATNANRFQPSVAIDKTRAEQLDNLIFMIQDSKTVNVCYHANDPNVGLGLSANRAAYKMFIADTGLFVTLAFWDKSFTNNIIYQKLLNDNLSVNLGYVYENVVAQMLVAAGNNLFYYTFPDANKHNYEVDFLLSVDAKLCPIEVKSEGYKSHRSIDEFCKKFSSRVSSRYLVYTKDLRHDKETTMLPIYMLAVLNDK